MENESRVLSVQPRYRHCAAKRAAHWRRNWDLTGPNLTLIATAISEIARNIVAPPNPGKSASHLEPDGKYGILIVANDEDQAFRT